MGIDSIWMYLQQLPFQHREEYTYAHISTNQPTNQPVSPSITPPLSSSLSYIFFFFLLNPCIHSLSFSLHHLPTSFLSSTYPPHFSPPLLFFSHTPHFSLTHTHPSTYLPHTHPSLLTTAISSPWPFHFSFFTFTFRPYNNSLHTPIIKHHMTVFFKTKFVEL